MAHPPPLLLNIDYHDHDNTAEGEEAEAYYGDGGYPILEYIILADPPKDKSTVLQ
jgi:hypothetical protein